MGMWTYSVIIFVAAITVILIALLLSKNKDGKASYYALAIPCMISAVWALVFCWTWFYYFNLYLAAPALIISLLLFYFVVKIGPKERLTRIILFNYALTFLITIGSAMFFGKFSGW